MSICKFHSRYCDNYVSKNILQNKAALSLLTWGGVVEDARTVFERLGNMSIYIPELVKQPSN